MLLAFFNGRADEAAALKDKSAEWLEKFHAGDGDKSEAHRILSLYASVAYQFMLEERSDEALRLSSRGTDLAAVFDRQGFGGTFLRISALVSRQRGDLEEALKQIQEVVRLQDHAVSLPEFNYPLAVVIDLTAEGEILGEEYDVNLGRSKEAVWVLERAFKIADDLVHKDPNDQPSRDFLSYPATSLADILRHTNANRALAVYDHALRHLGEINNTHRQDVFLLAGSSYALRRLGRPAEARQRLDAAFARLRQLKLYPTERIRTGSEQERALCALADYEVGTGNPARAIDVYQELLDKLGAGGAKPETSLHDALDLSQIWRSMAALRRRTGRKDLASSLEARRLDLWRRWDQRLPNNPFVLRQIAATQIP
jgi:tetratricopeptide (TPR) repeat protein